MTNLPFILASSSPRRLALLKDIGIVPDKVMSSDIEEAPHPQELPRKLAARMALEKMKAISEKIPEPAVILTADTVVGCGRRILPKARTPEEVRKCLKLLSGRRHHVYTAVALKSPSQDKIMEKLSDSVVAFRRMTDDEIEEYVACGEGIGKAGGYAIQGRAAAFISFIRGSYSGIVGLPLFETSQLLKQSNE
ncbi:MAG: Maf family protein [Alphaproteobacteria bacterium]|nr:Maf family protein [Alphaproteobacteria bacterium]